MPAVFPVRQRFKRPVVADIRAAVLEELARLFPPGRLREGARIGVTVGSRGITAIAEITRAAVDFIRDRGARPFILPAMGSHGGASAEGQTRLIAHLGVTEESTGAPILAAMTTRSLGKTPEGVEVFLAETALDSDGVLVINRIKPHTDYKGKLESGLAKLCAIGLGKYDGAREYHAHLFDIGLGGAIASAARRVLATGKIVGGLGILENAYHETARVAAVGTDDFLDGEGRLLEEARTLMGRLPLDEIDVLVLDRIGKNISGTGLDTNVVGRNVHGSIEGIPWQKGMPVVWRIVVRDLSAESEGNAVGMGMVDFATERFLAKVDFRATMINAVTACAPANVKTPGILANDREAIGAALSTAPRRPGGPILAHARDTLELERLYLSEACRPLIEGRSDVEILGDPEPLDFDAGGNLASPFM
jgi:hypothetical protein